jgi:hypothetical protein
MRPDRCEGKILCGAIQRFMGDRDAIFLIRPSVANRICNVEKLRDVPLELVANFFVTATFGKIHSCSRVCFFV